MVAHASGTRVTSRRTQLAALWAARPAGVRAIDPWRVAGAIVILLLIPWPLWLLLSQGFTITGFAEESTGYRYFYSLRLLYGDHERPLLPQGHLVGLIHMGIQVLLTVLGYPPTQLFPRVDIWAYTAALLPFAATAAAYVWAVRPLPGPGRLGVALLLLVDIYQIRTSTFWHLLQPDYYTWVHAVAMLTIGLLLRLAERAAPVRLRDAVVAGLFAGACLSVKVTWVTFPLAVTVLLLARTVWPVGGDTAPPRTMSIRALVQSLLRAVGFAGVIAGLAVAVFFSVLLVYHQFDVAAVQEHLDQQSRFLGQAAMPRSFEDWFSQQMLAWPPDVLALGAAAPAVLAVSVLALPRRWVSFALLPSAVAAILVAFQRSYTPTYVETSSYGMVVMVAWAATVLLPFIREIGVSCKLSSPRALLVSRMVGGFGVAALLFTSPIREMVAAPPRLLASFAASTALTHRIEHFVNDSPGKTAFFILNNLHRPLTIHTALAKGGGSSVFDVTWGNSPLLNRMFPNEAFFFDRGPGGPPDLAEFDRFVFGSAATPTVTAQARIPETWKVLNDVYNVASLGFQCRLLEDQSHYSYLEPVAIVGCERNPDRTWNGRSKEPVLMIPREAASEKLPVTVDRRGRTHELEPGDLIFSMVPNGIWRMGKGGEFSRLVAPEGTEVTVANAGPWDQVRKRYEGLKLIAGSHGRWQVQASNARAVNRSEHFDGSPDNPLGEGWWMSSGTETFTLERLEDESGPFVRVHATQALPHLLVTGADGLRGVEGVPITLRARIRSKPGAMQTLTVYDYGESGNPTVNVDRVVADGEWKTLTLQINRTRGGNTSDHYTAGVVGIQPGDWFDIQEFSLFFGMLPDGDGILPVAP